MDKRLIALGMWFFGLIAIFVALLHILLSAMAETAPHTTLILGLGALGLALLVAGAQLWRD